MNNPQFTTKLSERILQIIVDKSKVKSNFIYPKFNEIFGVFYTTFTLFIYPIFLFNYAVFQFATPMDICNNPYAFGLIFFSACSIFYILFIVGFNIHQKNTANNFKLI
jgi:hypothetical protein